MHQQQRRRIRGCIATYTALVCFNAAGAPSLITPLEGATTAPHLRRMLQEVDTRDRAQVAEFYKAVYYASEGIESGWRGSVTNCIAGTNSLAYAEATVLRVNFYRAMAGLPSNVRLDTNLNPGCQDAALMMSAERRVSHSPTPTWSCYTQAGANAAARSNILLGRAGPEAIDSYLDDQGAGNYFVGHRRWILYPPQATMGTGSVPTGTDWLASNALYVLAPMGSRPAKPEWVAWPPAGFIPYPILPRRSDRWSFSYPSADFANATVTMTSNGVPISVTLEPLEDNQGFGDNTLVWRPDGIPTRAPTNDVTYQVTVGGVEIGAQTRTFDYTVAVFDAEAPLIVATAWLPPGRVNVGYSAVLRGLGGKEPYWWSLAPDSRSLPLGIALAGSGVFRGTPQEGGLFNLTVRVSDSTGTTADRALALLIQGGPLTIDTPALRPGEVGTPYNQRLEARGGTPPYSWSLSSTSEPLPDGLRLDAEGDLSGTPTEPGSFDIGLRVTDSRETTAEQSLSLRIDPQPLSILTTNLSPVVQDVLFDVSLQASGGVPPYQWAVATPTNLPAGVTLSLAGVLGGIPADFGAYTLEIHVTDSTPQTTFQALELEVIPLIARLTVSQQSSDTIAVRGFELNFSANAAGRYAVQASGEFNTWDDLLTFDLADSTTNLLDTSATNAPARLYRVRRE